MRKVFLAYKIYLEHRHAFCAAFMLYFFVYILCSDIGLFLALLLNKLAASFA